MVRAFWWQEGLHLKPSSQPEAEALNHLRTALATLGLVESSDDVPPSPSSDSGHEQAVVLIHEL